MSFCLNVKFFFIFGFLLLASKESKRAFFKFCCNYGHGFSFCEVVMVSAVIHLFFTKCNCWVVILARGRISNLGYRF